MDRFKHWVKPRIIHGKPTKYGWVVYHPNKLKLGKYTDIGHGVFNQAKYGVTIEDYAQVGGGAYIYTYNSENGTKGSIIIKKNAKIGALALILPKPDGSPLIIGENSFVGALTVVTKDVPDNFYYANQRITRMEPI